MSTTMHSRTETTKCIQRIAGTYLATGSIWVSLVLVPVRWQRLKRLTKLLTDVKPVASPVILHNMGFRFQKRVKLGGGLGLNISRSGISPSLRTKAGTLSAKGVSVRTGVKGVSYNKTFKRTNNTGCLVVIFLLMLLPFVLLRYVL